nr:hypothetical protein [Plasmopara viticola lesion associated mononegaambi virus 8]
MNSLISQARSKAPSSIGSERSSRDRVPVREDRFILEQYHGGSGVVHKSLRSDVILRGVVFQADRTSLTRSCDNIVSRNQFMLQTLENLNNIMACIRYQLTIAGGALRDQGFLYDQSFPSPLRDWIVKNVPANIPSTTLDLEFDEDILKSLVGQLIMINSIRGSVV